MDLNARPVPKTYFGETPLFVNEAQIPFTMHNLLFFHVNIPMCTPNRYTCDWYVIGM